MKTSFVASSVFLFLMAKAAFSAEVNTTKVGELTDPTIWSSGALPTSTERAWLQANGPYTLNQDLTLTSVGTNWSNRGVTVSMVDSDGYKIENPDEYHTLTIDGNSTTQTLIELRSNSGDQAVSDTLSFENGNYVFKIDKDDGEIKFTTSTNTIHTGTKEVSAITKRVEFQANTNVRVENNILLSGTNSSLVNQSYYIFDGIFNAQDSAGNYKQISAGYTNVEVGGLTSASAITLWGDSVFTINSGGRVDALTHFNLMQASAVINGTLNTPKVITSDNTQGFTVGATGVLNISSSFDIHSDINVNAGGVVNSKAVSVNAGTLYLDGTLNQSTDETITQNILIDAGATLKVGETGKLSLSGGYKNINVFGTLDISGAENSINFGSNGYAAIRIQDGGTLILRSTNAICLGDSSGQSNFNIWSYSGQTRVEILANNDIYALGFVTGANMTLVLGEDVDLLTMQKISNKIDAACAEGLADDTISLTIEGFRENTIKIASVSDADKREDGYLDIIADGWKDFYIDENGFLAATAVPEPAVFAAIFGAIALGFASMRRRAGK